MIEERARVVRVDGGLAEIVTQQQSSCGSCAAKAGCGTSLLATWLPQRRLSFRLTNDIGASPGDLVVVGLDETLLQRNSLLLYALPLAGLLLGAIAGERGFLAVGLPAELGAVLAGLLGVSAALLLVRRLTASNLPGGQSGLRLLRVVDGSRSFAPGDIAVPDAHQPREFRK